MRKLLLALMTVLLLGFLMGVFASFFYLYNRLYPRISIANFPVGLLTKEEAINYLDKEIGKKTPKYLVLKHKTSEWLIDPLIIGLEPRTKLAVEKAFGNRGLKLLFYGEENLPLTFDLDTEKLSQSIATISAALSYPAQEPQILLRRNKISIIEGHDGQELDVETVANIIKDQAAHLKFSPIELPVRTIKTVADETQIDNTRRRAEILIRRKLNLLIQENTNILLGTQIVNFLDFTNGFDREKITAFVTTLSQSYNRKPENAMFQIENGEIKEKQSRVILFRPSQLGIKLDEEESVNQILENLQKLENQEEEEITIELAFETTQPEITNEDANNLGIKEMIGRGISFYTGSIASRIHNLSLAAAKINGVLVQPNHIFSFNKTLGDVSVATGYQAAYIIKDGRTILGDGGGICQDSTTLFRAVLDAGLPIIERHAHSYRVSPYEEGGFKPGLDATVFSPSADFKFKNDTPNYILIQTRVDKPKNKLVYEIYGTSDGRTATISNHRVWDQQPPPEPLYQDEPTLPNGTVKQVDFAAWGAKAAFDYQVKRHGITLIERTFYSNFKPWQAIFLRGTGG